MVLKNAYTVHVVFEILDKYLVIIEDSELSE